MLEARFKEIAALFDVCNGQAHPGSVSAPQRAILRAVAADQGLSLGALGQRLGMKQSGLSRMVERMVGRGMLLRRKRVDDKRVAALHLDVAGQAYLTSIASADYASRIALRGIGRDDQMQLNRLLDRVAANLSAAEETSARADEAQKNALKKLRAFF